MYVYKQRELFSSADEQRYELESISHNVSPVQHAALCSRHQSRTDVRCVDALQYVISYTRAQRANVEQNSVNADYKSLICPSSEELGGRMTPEWVMVFIALAALAVQIIVLLIKERGTDHSNKLKELEKQKEEP